MSNLKRCLPYTESKKTTEEQQGTTLGVQLKEVSLPYKDSKEMTEEQQRPTLGVQLKGVSAL